MIQMVNENKIYNRNAVQHWLCNKVTDSKENDENVVKPPKTPVMQNNFIAIGEFANFRINISDTQPINIEPIMLTNIVAQGKI